MASAYISGVNEKMLGQLPTELQQSLTFLWVFMLKTYKEMKEFLGGK